MNEALSNFLQKHGFKEHPFIEKAAEKEEKQPEETEAQKKPVEKEKKPKRTRKRTKTEEGAEKQ